MTNDVPPAGEGAGNRPGRGFRLCSAALLTLLTIGLAGPAAAADFADLFVDRDLLTEVSGELTGSNAGATREPDEPRHGGKPGGSSVWVSWVAPADGVATFGTDGSSFDTLISAYYFAQPGDTTLDKLKEAARNDDAPGAEPASLIQWGARAGTTYHIAVDGFRGGTGAIRLRWDFVAAASPPPIIVSVPADQAGRSGDPITLAVAMQVSPELDLQWRFNGNSIGATGPTLVIPSLQRTNVGHYALRIRIGDVRFETTPAELQINSEGQTNALARDKLFDALESPLTPDDAGGNGPGAPPGVKPPPPEVTRGYNGTQIFNTTYATVDPDEPAHCGLAPAATYWFAYQPPADGTLLVDTIGSDYDTFLAVYTYDPPLTSYGGLIPVHCDNNSGGGTASRLEFAAPQAKRFFVVIGSVSGVRGIVHLNYTFDTNRPPAAPVLEPLPTKRVVAAGASVTLIAHAVGSAPLNYTWFKGETPLAGQIQANLVFPQVQFSDEGDYRVRVSNYLGQASHPPLHLRVVLPPRLDYDRRKGLDVLSFASREGQIYRLETLTQLGTTNWLPTGNALTGDGTSLSFTNATPDRDSGFYRVEVE